MLMTLIYLFLKDDEIWKFILLCSSFCELKNQDILKKCFQVLNLNFEICNILYLIFVFNKS